MKKIYGALFRENKPADKAKPFYIFKEDDFDTDRYTRLAQLPLELESNLTLYNKPLSKQEIIEELEIVKLSKEHRYNNSPIKSEADARIIRDYEELEKLVEFFGREY